nr:ClassA_beta_lactamase [uncultured bacterium]
MKIKPLLLACFLIILSSFKFTGGDLQNKIETIISSTKADIGVAVMVPSSHDTILVNGMKPYTMMSVVKFPQAVYILSLVDRGKLRLSQKVNFDAAELQRKTHSPMRDKYGKDPFEVTLEETIMWAVSHSDNIACDRLFELGGGVAANEKYFQDLGYHDFAIGVDYKHLDEKTMRANNTSPLTMTRILERFYNGKLLAGSSRNLLLKFMTQSQNPEDRIKGNLPKGTVVAHKTGTSAAAENGTIQVFNDVGIITLPSGKQIILSVFVSASKEKSDDNAKAIAAIAKAVFDHYSN